tara:strand:- start:271 stop:579 length:309 start_codon:yes stop_codon:yes gene_type:complete
LVLGAALDAPDVPELFPTGRRFELDTDPPELGAGCFVLYCWMDGATYREGLELEEDGLGGLDTAGLGCLEGFETGAFDGREVVRTAGFADKVFEGTLRTLFF